MKAAVRYLPDEIIIEESVRETPMTRRVLEKLKGVPTRTLPDSDQIRFALVGDKQAQTKGKKVLALVEHKGKFLKPRADVPHYRCYNYHYLYWGSNCHLECTYCILQAFLNNPLITLHANTDDLKQELTERFQEPNSFWRISSGEVADSLAMEPITGLMEELIPFFSEKNNAVLELKTKTSLVDSILKLNHRGRTIVSWSLNTPKIIQEEELKTSDLESRLAAAKKVEEAGYPIGFHFDPMVYYENWEEDYQKLIEQVFSLINPKRVAWISLGGLRFLPEMKPIIQQRFPKSKIIYGEQIRGTDGKSRYFRPLRAEMFGKMNRWLKQIAPDLFTYLCMETPEVWQQSLGFTPETDEHLSQLMDHRALSFI